MSEKAQTRLAQFVSLGVGIFAIVVSIILANSNITSAYDWFNGFMGLVLGILIGVFLLGAFSRKQQQEAQLQASSFLQLSWYSSSTSRQ